MSDAYGMDDQFVPELGQDCESVVSNQVMDQGNERARYLRALGLELPVQSTIDHRAVLDLVKINADLGRLGGLIKMWLTSNDSWESSSTQTLQRKLDGTLNEIRALQKKMSDRLQNV